MPFNATYCYSNLMSQMINRGVCLHRVTARTERLGIFESKNRQRSQSYVFKKLSAAAWVEIKQLQSTHDLVYFSSKMKLLHIFIHSQFSYWWWQIYGCTSNCSQSRAPLNSSLSSHFSYSFLNFFVNVTGWFKQLWRSLSTGWKSEG